MSGNERRGFFDECHLGEIDPGYYWLEQDNVGQVGEVWATAYKIEALFYSTYVTPGKGQTTVQTTFAYKGDPTDPQTPTLVGSIGKLKGNQPFTHVRYSGVFVQVYP